MGLGWTGMVRYGMILLLCVLIFDISVVIALNLMFVFSRRHPSGHVMITVLGWIAAAQLLARFGSTGWYDSGKNRLTLLVEMKGLG
jgi:hypothetical protein